MERRNECVRLAEAFGGIARALLHEHGIDDTLGRVVTETLRLIEPCEHASIERVARGVVEPIVASSEVARLIDQIQMEVGQGPILDALRHHEVFRTGNLAEESRWPAFARPAHERTGIRSMMAFRLWTEEETQGVLTISSTLPDAFDEGTEAIGSVLAAHAALAWWNARHSEQMEEALRTRDLIGQAKGILMHQHGIGDDEAFDLLREASQRANLKLRDLVHQVVDGRGLFEQ